MKLFTVKTLLDMSSRMLQLLLTLAKAVLLRLPPVKLVLDGVIPVSTGTMKTMVHFGICSDPSRAKTFAMA
jgi:hypothetical protein